MNRLQRQRAERKAQHALAFACPLCGEALRLSRQSWWGGAKWNCSNDACTYVYVQEKQRGGDK